MTKPTVKAERKLRATTAVVISKALPKQNDDCTKGPFLKDLLCWREVNFHVPPDFRFGCEKGILEHE